MSKHEGARAPRALLRLIPIAAAGVALVGCLPSWGSGSRVTLAPGSNVPVSCSGPQLQVVSVSKTSANLVCAPLPTTTTVAGQASAYDQAVAALPGLALWAPLSETGGTVATDQVAGQGNGSISSSGVTFGALDTVAGAGASHAALKIGTGSVQFPNNSALNLSTTASSAWLAMVDVQVDATSGYPIILSKGDRLTNGFAVFADPANNAVGYMVNGHQYAWDGVSLSTMENLALGWDGSNLTLFVNGAQVGTATATAAAATDSGPLSVGAGGGVTVSKLIVTNHADTASVAGIYSTLTTGATATTTALSGPTTTLKTGSTGTVGVTANGAKLLWSDEFNGAAGTGVNTGTWEQQVGAPTNNGRVEYLTAGTHNVAEDGNGNLVVTSRRESYGGRDYTSGRIESNTSFTTGYLEFRAKVPTWQGTMPGLWTYGAAGYGSSTGFSEIDALEIETAADPTNVRQTIHGGMPDGQIWQLGWSNNEAQFAPQLPGDAWHTYGAYVNPTDHSVTFYVDGVAKETYQPGQQLSGGTWPYGQYAQKIIIETEMGGYSGTPTTDKNSDTLSVDYVRVYDKPPY